MPSDTARLSPLLLWLLLPLARLSAAKSLGCTALAIDGSASATGSAFAIENTDCNQCDFRLNYVPARQHAEGDQRPVYLGTSPMYPRWVGYGRGENYHPQEGQKLSEPIAHIPEVPYTYGYYESINALMNDQGLGMGESSCAAMLQNRNLGQPADGLLGPEAILDAMSLMQLALERCATARCAVELLADLGERYGYLPYGGEPTEGQIGGRTTWADSGEAFTFADATGEAWVLNMVGGVDGITKAVWAAQRVPKGYLAVVANEFAMGVVPEEPTEDILFSKNLRKAALAAGLWDGQEPLVWNQVFAPDPTMYNSNGNPPIPLYTSLRRWRLLSLAAPSLNIKFEFDHRKYPWAVKVEKPLTHRDLFEMMRDHYAGTEFDMREGVLAGPFRTPFRVEGGPSHLGDVPRGLSILRTLYSTITDTGPNGSVVWYAPDTPATSVYLPLDHRTGAVGPSLSTGQHEKFDRTSAWWAFDFVNNWMQLNYEGMSKEDVFPRMEAWQDRIDREFQARKHLDVKSLAAWQTALHEEVAKNWWSLADFLVGKWNDMARTSDTITDKAVGYPEPWAKLVGFNNDIHPLWVRPSASPATPYPGYVASTVQLPRHWDAEKQQWMEIEPLPEDHGCVDGLAAMTAKVEDHGSAAGVLLGAAFLAAFSTWAGFCLGWRRGTKAASRETVGTSPMLGAEGYLQLS